MKKTTPAFQKVNSFPVKNTNSSKLEISDLHIALQHTDDNIDTPDQLILQASSTPYDQ